MKKAFRHKKRLAHRIMRVLSGMISVVLTLTLMVSAALGLSLTQDELISVAAADTVTGGEDPSASVGDGGAETSVESDDADMTSTNEAQPESGMGQASAAPSFDLKAEPAEISADLPAGDGASSGAEEGKTEETSTGSDSSEAADERTASDEDGEAADESGASDEDGEATDESDASDENGEAAGESGTTDEDGEATDESSASDEDG